MTNKYQNVIAFLEEEIEENLQQEAAHAWQFGTQEEYVAAMARMVEFKNAIKLMQRQ